MEQFYFIDDETGLIWIYDLVEQTRPGLRAISAEQAMLILNPPPTPEQIVAMNQGRQEELITEAARSMAPILEALPLGDSADPETVTARAWQVYFRELNAVDLTPAHPVWPVIPL